MKRSVQDIDKTLKQVLLTRQLLLPGQQRAIEECFSKICLHES